MGKATLVLLVVAACGDDGGTMIPADAPISESGCALRWEQTAMGGTAIVEGGSLKLATPSLASGIAMQVVQHGLEGDFVASFTVKGWTAGGSGAYLQAVIADEQPTPRIQLTAGIGTHPTVGVSVTTLSASDVQPTTATDVTFRFERVNTGMAVDMTATAMTATATSTINYTAHGAPPLKIGLQLGTNDAAIGATSVEITDFAVTGPMASGAADAFDCDSLLP